MNNAVSRAQNRWATSDVDADLFAAFAAYERAANLAITTIRNRASILRTLQKHTGMSLLDVSIRELRSFIGRPSTEAGEPRAAGSMRTERAAVRAFYAFLVADGYLEVSPAEKLASVHVPKGEPRPFSPEQIDAMLAAGAYRKTRAMILLGYYQGFRVSSIARVHGRDIDLEEGTIRTVAKGGKTRTVPLHPVIAELALVMPRDWWWFPGRGTRLGHGPVRATSVTERITAAKVRAGITDPTLTPHSLRHAFGTDLVEAGVDIRVVQELMLHESLSTTQIYTRVSGDRKRDGIQTLGTRALPTRSGRPRTDNWKMRGNARAADLPDAA